MSGGRVPRRVAAWLVAGLTGLVVAAPAAHRPRHRRRGSATQFEVDAPNVVRRANIVLGLAAADQATQLMPLGNGQMGAAVWGADGFTAQINRTDTWPTRRSPGQVTIPGLAPLTNARDYTGSVDLYDATFRQQGGGMTATTYVRADKDELVVDVTGADPNSTQTARINLQTGRNPTAGADGAIARLAETWVDTGSVHRRHRQDVRLARRGHRRRPRTSPRASSTRAPSRSPSSPTPTARSACIVGSPDVGRRRRRRPRAPRCSAATRPRPRTCAPRHLQWWHDYWAKVGLMRLSSADGTADYMENLRTIFLYIEGATERGTFPTSQAGTNPLFNFSRDSPGLGRRPLLVLEPAHAARRPTSARATRTSTCRASASTATTSTASAAGRRCG